MKTTILINDIKQDYRQRAFFSPSACGLGYSTLPPEAFGEIGGNDYASEEEKIAFYKAADAHAKYIKSHWIDLEINGRGEL